MSVDVLISELSLWIQVGVASLTGKSHARRYYRKAVASQSPGLLQPWVGQGV
jgi:hypothetical protein